MRILFFNYEYPPLGGGAANATKNIMVEMAKLGKVTIDVVTSSVDARYHQEKIGKNVVVHRLPIGKKPENLTYQSKKELITYTIKAYFFARKLQKKHRYDLTHAFFAVPCGFISLLLKIEFGLPYIISMRGSDVPGYSQRFRWMYPFIRSLIVVIWKKSVAVVANSEGLKKLALESNPKQPIRVIYNGINTDVFRPLEREDDGVFEIICASRLSKRKGFRYVIDAVAKLLQHHPNIHLTIAGGEGDAEGELKKQVAELGLGENVTFTGHYVFEEIVPLYQKADVFVFPSFNEGMSNNMLEAMACGLPIIMTPTGGAEELVRDGENGFMINFADSDAIADKISRLIGDRRLRGDMGRSSRQSAEQMSWRRVAESYFQLYGSLQQRNEDHHA